MKSLVVAASLALVLSGWPAFAQSTQPAGQAQPAQQPPAQQEVMPPLQPPAPFPQGATVAFVNLQAVAQLSADGKAASAKVQALGSERTKEIAERTKTLQGLQQKLQTGAGVMTDQARAQLERDIDKLSRDLERFQQDAQVDLNELQAELQGAFQEKLLPVLEALAQEKGLHFLFSAADAGLIWAAPGLDLTMEAVQRLDAAK